MQFTNSKWFLLAFTSTILAAQASPAIQSQHRAHSQTFAPTMQQKDIDQFATVMAQIQYYYIDPVPYSQLFTNAIHGMVSQLDPHSTYLPANDLKSLMHDTHGEYAGIGISINVEDGLLRVITPIDDSPAFKAGILPNDIIFKVNSKMITEIGVDKALENIQGKPGTRVTISVYRPKTKNIKKFTIKRDKLKIETVKTKIINRNLALIRISSFGEKTTNELKSAIKKLKKNKNIQGYILDVRNNPGGLLHTAVETTDLFIDSRKHKNHTIVSTKGRLKMMDTVANATPGDIIPNKPIVVLINHGSASASEILAAALSDYNRAITMGTQTFGKGSVQTILPTSDDAAIKLTTALYYTPNGESIQAKGVKPDIIVQPLQLKEKTNDDRTMHDLINEASLDNHIANKDRVDTGKKDLNTADLDVLAREDFQLYQAAKVLETMLLAQNMKRTQ